MIFTLRVLVGLMLLAIPAVGAAQGAWRTVETTHVGAFTLTVQSQADGTDTPRLTIAGPGGATTIVSLSDGLATVKDAMTVKSLAARNTLHSQYVFATGALKAAGAGDRVVVVFGAASDPDPFAIRVLELGANGQVKTLLAEDAFELIAITLPDKSGAPELIGRPSWSQMDTKCLSTYDPQAVYRLSAGKYVYDEALSKAYALAHYVWAGPKSREDVAVDLCHKPLRLVPAPKT
jgi:hypothetical protein